MSDGGRRSHPNVRPTDGVAASMPWMASIPPCLHIPIAARGREAIERYVGGVAREIIGQKEPSAFVVEIHPTPTIDHRLPAWNLVEAEHLHAKEQLWIHVECRHYRRIFKQALPRVDVTGKDVDHVMNREMARVLGFSYIRLVPIASAANRSSGALAEKWAIKYAQSVSETEVYRNRCAQVQYADITDIMKMLSISIGGGVTDAVNDAQTLFEVPKGL